MSSEVKLSFVVNKMGAFRGIQIPTMHENPFLDGKRAPSHEQRLYAWLDNGLQQRDHG
jgi:hypothetical protein